MRSATPQMRNLAARLIAHDAAGKKSAGIKIPAAFPPLEKLRPHLAVLVGNGGFRALLSRALSLATAELPWLRSAHVKADGSLAGVEELDAYIGPDELLEGRVVLLAYLLDLLDAFIGQNLTLRLVREVWPKVAPSDPEPAGTRKTGKKK